MFSSCTQSSPLVTKEEQEASPAFPTAGVKGEFSAQGSGVVGLVISSDFAETSHASEPLHPSCLEVISLYSSMGPLLESKPTCLLIRKPEGQPPKRVPLVPPLQNNPKQKSRKFNTKRFPKCY